MVRILCFLCLIACSFQLSATEFGHEIKIKVKGCDTGLVKLGYHFGDKQYLQDSSYINNNGYAVFKGDEPLKGGIYFALLPTNDYFEFLVNEQFFSLETEKGNLATKMKSIGSVENQLFYQNLNRVKDVEAQLKSKSEELKKTTDSKKKTKIENEIEEIRSNSKKQLDNLINENSETLFASIMKASQEPEIPDELIGEEDEVKQKRYKYYKAHYFDGFNFNDPRLARTPILNTKVNYFVDKLSNQTPDSLIVACDYLISLTENADTNHYKFLVTSLLNKYANSKIMGQDAVYVYLAKKYYTKEKAWWVNFADLYRITERAKDMEPTLIGKKARDIRLKDWDGNYVKLYDIKTPYTVLYFWDPDCGHCKKMTPKLVKFLDENKGRGVTVFSATIEKEEPKWRKYITDNKLDDKEGWINLGDFEFKSRFREDYDITGTPRLFLLDENKIIKAKRINPEQLIGIMDMLEKQKAEASQNIK